MRHIITEEDISITFDKKILLAHSGGHGKSKSLFWLPVKQGNSSYEVMEHNEVVLTTFFLDEAIAVYNDLP